MTGADRTRNNCENQDAAVPSSRARPCRRFRPAALRHRSIGQPAEPHRGGAEDLDLEHARADARAVQCRPARLLYLRRDADRPRLDRRPVAAARPRRELQAHRRAHARAQASPERALPQRRRHDRRGRGLQLRAGADVDRQLGRHARHVDQHHARPHQQGAAAGGAARSRWPPIPASSGWRSSTNTPCGSSTACPTRRWKAG